MHIYEPTLEYLRIIGLNWNQSIQKYPLNECNLIGLFVFGLNLICNVGYLVSGAVNLKNATDSMQSTLTLICATLIFMHLIWMMRELFEFYSKVDDIVTQSKRML